jgi:DNA topoisomerase-1
VDIAAADYLFRATASVLQFPGFTAVYQESREEEETNGVGKLPPLATGEVLQLRDFDPQQHFTKPPARYTEASLIKELEVQGIGRPSTYATILSNLQDRLYVAKEKVMLRPTEMGMVVSDLLVESFPEVMDPKFTAGLESDLDRIAADRVPWQQVLRDFYGPFRRELEGAKDGMRRVKSVPSGLACPLCGGELVVRWGKNGEFLGCSAYPQCGFTSNFSHDSQGLIIINQAGELSQAARGKSGRPTGIECPQCQKELLVRHGRKGEFLGCSGYPKCKFTQNFSRDDQGKIIPIAKKVSSPKKVEGVAALDYPCPKLGCGGHLVKSGELRTNVYSCSNSLKCQLTLKQKPISRQCPRCDFPWLLKKGKKILCPRDECGYEESTATAKAASG